MTQQYRVMGLYPDFLLYTVWCGVINARTEEEARQAARRAMAQAMQLDEVFDPVVFQQAMQDCLITEVVNITEQEHSAEATAEWVQAWANTHFRPQVLGREDIALAA